MKRTRRINALEGADLAATQAMVPRFGYLPYVAEHVKHLFQVGIVCFTGCSRLLCNCTDRDHRVAPFAAAFTAAW